MKVLAKPTRKASTQTLLIETHINGALGKSFSNSTPEEIVHIRRHLRAQHNIGGFVASLVSLPKTAILRGIKAIQDAASGPGAEILGIHLEGPFLSPAQRGAHLQRHLRLPDVREFSEYVRAADGHLKMITIAPELPGALDVIREAARVGVIASLGHSNATLVEARRAIAAGASHVTHLFNAMSGFHHREPGLVGAGLLEPVYVEVIYDRVHVSREAMKLVLKCKDPGRIVLASDASPALDAPDGNYTFDGIPTVIREGQCVTQERGGLAGSMASLRRCFQNFQEDFGGGEPFVIQNPGRLLGKVGERSWHKETS